MCENKKTVRTMALSQRSGIPPIVYQLLNQIPLDNNDLTPEW